MRFFLTLLLLSAAPAFAQLKFEEEELNFHKEPADKKVEAKFAFKNVGDKPVRIKALHSSCGCTKPTVEKTEYKPGEGGEILTKFEFGFRRGEQRKMVWVQFEDPELKPAMLYLNVFIQEPLKVSPSFVYWRQGEKNNVKSIEIKSEPKNPVRILDVTASDPRLKARLKILKPGTHYLLSVRPEETAEPLAGTLQIKTDYPPDSPRVYTVHAQVK